LHRKACDQGEPRACTQLGTLYLQGIGGPRDNSLAFGLLDRGCKGGHAAACEDQAMFYKAIDKVIAQEKADPRAGFHVLRELYRRGCEGGEAHSCAEYGSYLEYGMGGPKDPAGALRYFGRACDGGDAKACASMALSLAVPMDKKATPDPTRAAQYWERGCTGGDAGSCSSLASLYRNGRGVPADPKRARELLRRSCILLPDKQASTACLQDKKLTDPR
jgi:TPR repeat protein